MASSWGYPEGAASGALWDNFSDVLSLKHTMTMMNGGDDEWPDDTRAKTMMTVATALVVLMMPLAMTRCHVF